MRVILAGRRFGKTLRLVSWVQQGELIMNGFVQQWSRVLLTCHGQQEQKRLMQQFGLEPTQVYTLEDWKYESRGRDHTRTEVVIDDVNVLWERVVGPFRVDAVSINDPDEIFHLAHRPRRSGKAKYYPSQREHEIEAGQTQLEE